MDVIDEPQLFGAGLGDVRAASLATTKHETGAFTINVWVHVEMREQPMWLRIRCADAGQAREVIGASVPLLNRSTNMSGQHAKRTLWWMHDKFGKAGMEVALERCSRPRR